MVATVGQVLSDWSSFWQLFKQFSTWATEWYDGSAWVNRDSCMQIIRTYPNETTCKISLNFTSQEAGDYRFTFAIKERVRNYVEKLSKYQYELEYEGFSVIFDWSDIASIAGLEITHGIKDGLFWFRVKKAAIPANFDFVLDPSVVGTSTSTTPVIYGFQKKCFYANGRWWVFYYDGTNFGWRTSTDGSSWSSFSNYGAYPPQRFDIWYDEANNKICLARCGGSSGSVYYRQGTANSDGTITWDSNEVTVNSDASTYGVRVCKDSNGYPWISYLSAPTPNYEKVVKANTTSGSSWDVPTTLWTDRGNGQEEIIIVPLSNGRMMALSSASQTASRILSRLYDGSSWAASVTASTSYVQNYNYYDAVADGDNVHLVFCKVTSYDIVYVKYLYGTGWGSEETVESATVSQNHPAISFKSADKVRVFYLLSQTTIKYRDRDSGSWQAVVTISSSESTMTCVCSSYKPFSSKLCVTWKSGLVSPYNVKFEGYTLAEVILKEVTDSLALSDAVLRDKILAISDSVGLVDTPLRDKIFQILDELNLADIIFRGKTFTVTDLISLSESIEVAAGAIIKYVADAIGLTEQIRVEKVFIVSDAIYLADAVSTPMRILHALDSIGLSDNAYVNKILIISDQIALAEVVEKAVAGGVKTKIFLLIGDLAIQIAG